MSIKMNFFLIGLLYIILGTWSKKKADLSITGNEYVEPFCGTKDTVDFEHNPISTLSPRLKRSEEVMCRGLCEPKKIQPCHCDSLCHAYNDCCLEYTSKKLTSSFEIKSEVSCDLPLDTVKVFNKPFRVVMVKTCLKNHLVSSLVNRCSASKGTIDPLQIIPVTDKNGLTFANVYCALCNDVDDVSPWNLATFISDESLLSIQNLSAMIRTLGNYSVVIPVPEQHAEPRVCIASTDKGNSTKGDDDQCNEYQEPVLYATKVFRNRYCIPKNVIKGCNPDWDPYNCKPVCIKGRDIGIADYIFERNPRINSIQIKFGRQFQVQYESSKCASEELLVGSKIKCVHLGCTHSGNKHCKPFEIYYNNFRLYFLWHLRIHTSVSSETTRRCANMVLNLLWFSKIVSLSDFSKINSYEEKECDIKTMATAITYISLLPVADSKSLQTWLSTVHFTYIEITGDKRSVIQRIYPGKEDLSDTPHHTTCTKLGTRISVYRKEDKESMVYALARYPLPIPIYKCSHINITVSVEELNNGNGNTNRKYKVIEVHCTNKVPMLFAGSSGTLMMILFGAVLNVYNFKTTYC